MTVEVELPVCEKCGHVGKLPGGGSLTFNCTGPPEKMHTRTRMTMQTFRMVNGNGRTAPSSGAGVLMDRAARV